MVEGIMNKNKEMKSIWFIVGIILFVIGVIVLVAGIYDLFNPADQNTKLYYLHANIWWGIIILVVGFIYIIKNKNK
jgi:membrane protease YdiL (CAAX protease family)